MENNNVNEKNLYSELITSCGTYYKVSSYFFELENKKKE